MRVFFLNTLDTTVSIHRGTKLGYTLLMRSDYEETPNLKKHRIYDCPTHANEVLPLKKINELKSFLKIYSKKFERDDGLSRCSNFPKPPRYMS